MYQKNNIIDQFELCNDQLLMKYLAKKIKIIIDQQKSDPLSISFCTLIGKVILEQNSASSEQRKFAITCLQYAHNQNSSYACLGLLQTSNEELDRREKIHYLEENLYRNPNLIDRLQPILTALYPRTIYQQIHLIIYFINNNQHDLLKQYLSKMYGEHAPLYIDPTDLEEPLSNETMEQLIDLLLKTECIQKTVDSFMHTTKNKETPTTQECFGTIFCGSLLSYSLKTPQLIKGAHYLESVMKQMPLINNLTKNIQENIGTIYYKLAGNNKDNLTLYALYLQKGADFNNVNAMILLSDLWLKKNPATKNISSETIQKYIEIAHERKPNEQTRTLQQTFLQQQHKNLLPSPISTAHLNAAQNAINIIHNEIIKTETHIEGLQLLEARKKHPTVNFLVHKKASKNTNILFALSRNNMLDKSVFNLENANPYRCLTFALNNYPLFNKNKFELVKNTIQKALKNGLIKSKTVTFFKDVVILSFLCELIEKIMLDINNNSGNLEHDNSKLLIFLQTIKDGIQSVNMKEFYRFYNNFYKPDLTQSILWHIQPMYK